MGLQPSSHPQTSPWCPLSRKWMTPQTWIRSYQAPGSLHTPRPVEIPLNFTNTQQLSRHIQVLKKLRDPLNLPCTPVPTPIPHPIDFQNP